LLQEIETIKSSNEQIIKNSLDILRDIGLDLSFEDIELKKIDDIYADVITT